MKRSQFIATAAATAFVAVLFLPWQERVGVHMTGVMDVDNGSVGWNGPGAIAGICALVLIVLTLADVPLGAVTRAILGVALPVFAALAAFDGTAAHMGMGAGWLSIDVSDTRWPAWLGLGLAVVAAAATLAPLLRRPAGRSRPHPA